MDRVLEGFLEEQREQGIALAARSPLLELEPRGGALPDRWVARFACRGLVRAPGGEIVEAEGFSVGIWFPRDYLRAVNPIESVTFLGTRAGQRPFHPNMGSGPGGRTYICVGHLSPGTPLCDILLQCFEIITWQKVTMREDDALDRDACSWARAHLDRLPVDRRTLLGRPLPLPRNHPVAGPAAGAEGRAQ